jgi:hypothetical protein
MKPSHHIPWRLPDGDRASLRDDEQQALGAVIRHQIF